MSCPIGDLTERVEPDAYNGHGFDSWMLSSIAVSLKRIADQREPKGDVRSDFEATRRPQVEIDLAESERAICKVCGLSNETAGLVCTR